MAASQARGGTCRHHRAELHAFFGTALLYGDTGESGLDEWHQVFEWSVGCAEEYEGGSSS
jgi:hypothetical protein